eukprot:8326717-Pyramimonas_sp.AAC.1
MHYVVMVCEGGSVILDHTITQAVPSLSSIRHVISSVVVAVLTQILYRLAVPAIHPGGGLLHARRLGGCGGGGGGRRGRGALP